MDAAIKKLLQKEKPDAFEVCRILLANLVDIENDKKGMTIEQHNKINKIICESPCGEQYSLYLEIYNTVNEAKDLGNNLLRQAYLACSGLKLFWGNVFFANKDYPKINWEKYQLGNMSLDTHKQGKWLWLNLRTTLRASGAVKAAIKITGEFFEVPKLENVLLSDKPLRKEIDDLDEYSKQALTELKKKNIPAPLLKEAREIFTPLIFKNSQPAKSEIEEAKEKFDTGFFYQSFENMLDVLNPYYPEPIPGIK